MNIQRLTPLGKAIAPFTVALLMLPAIAACEPQTNQSPTATDSTQPSADVNDQVPTATDPGATGDLSIAEVAASETSLSTLTTAIDAAGLTGLLQGPGPYTVFAPSDEAFAAIPEATREQLLLPENREQLQQVLSYHVVPGELYANQLESGSINTAEGTPLTIDVNSGTQEVMVNNAMVTQPNVQASNGVIHIIDQVILPPNFAL